MNNKQDWKKQVKNYKNFNRANQGNSQWEKENNSSFIQLQPPPCLGNAPHPMLIPIRYWNKKIYTNNKNLKSNKIDKAIEIIEQRAETNNKTDTNANFTREADTMNFLKTLKATEVFNPVININIYNNNNNSNLVDSFNRSKRSDKKDVTSTRREDSFIQNISIGNIGTNSVSIRETKNSGINNINNKKKNIKQTKDEHCNDKAGQIRETKMNDNSLVNSTKQTGSWNIGSSGNQKNKNKKSTIDNNNTSTNKNNSIKTNSEVDDFKYMNNKITVREKFRKYFWLIIIIVIILVLIALLTLILRNSFFKQLQFIKIALLCKVSVVKLMILIMY